MCQSANRRRQEGGPEIAFRIVYLAPEGQEAAETLEQTVEVGLRTRGEAGSKALGSLRRTVSGSQVVHAVPPTRARRRRGRYRNGSSRSRVAETLRKAQEWQRQLEAGEVPSRAAIASREGLSRARVTQIMALLQLAPEVQEWVCSSAAATGFCGLSERTLWQVSRVEDSAEQIRQLKLLAKRPAVTSSP